MLQLNLDRSVLLPSSSRLDQRRAESHPVGHCQSVPKVVKARQLRSVEMFQQSLWCNRLKPQVLTAKPVEFLSLWARHSPQSMRTVLLCL